MQFFIAPVTSWLRTRRFSEPTFSTLLSHKSLEKHSVSGLSYLFAHLYLLSSDSFSSHLLSSNLPLLSASPLLCFSSVHIVGSLTSKLPSNNNDNNNNDNNNNVYIFIYSFIYLFTCILLDRVIAQDWPCQGGGNPSDKMYPTFEMGYRWV